MRSIAFAGEQPVTQVFGVNPADYARFALAGHNGADFGLWTGTEVYAEEDGTITEAYNDTAGYGLTTYLVADSGRGWRHGHYSRLDVAVGDHVKQGQRLGLSGSTGNSSGPHLHLGMRPPNANYGNGFNGYIDPLPTLAWLEEQRMDGIVAELNNQISALRAEVDGLNGVNTELGKQVNSLQWLLRISQGETAAAQAEAEQLRAAAGSSDADALRQRLAQIKQLAEV